LAVVLAVSLKLQNATFSINAAFDVMFESPSRTIQATCPMIAPFAGAIQRLLAVAARRVRRTL
jgi:hypothetical protein